MKKRSRLPILVIALCTVLMAASVVSVTQRLGSKVQEGEGLTLVRPAFAQSGDATFLEQEAGIAAYTNAGQQLNLTKANSTLGRKLNTCVASTCWLSASSAICLWTASRQPIFPVGQCTL